MANNSRQQYIDQYAECAMEQMRRYGIPASVTLAQGIIESANGKSTLARTANNHFGVKGEFNGAYVLANDDKPNERFKKYDNVGQSYEDHSKVLMASRYQKYVGNLSPDDYKGWAAGIKAGGYATAKNYVSTIVGVIEGSNLYKYDQMVIEQAKREGKKIGSGDYRKGEVSASTAQAAAAATPNGLYSLPLKRDEFMLVTSPFGNRRDPMNHSRTQFHKGIDIGCRNETLLATENNGKVVGVNHNANTGGGKSVTIEYNRADGSKYQTTYMHMSSIDVKIGDAVNAGQKIGVSGNSGTRTTGPHLHFEVKTIAADGTKRNIDPAAYIAEISQKGGLSQKLLYNGKDLLASYKAANPLSTETPSVAAEQEIDTNLSPDEWMKKILSSEDSGLGMTPGGDPVIEMAMTLFTSLMALAVQIDNKSEEEKMQAATDAAVNRQIDLTSLLPNMKECSLSLSTGSPLLTVDNGSVRFTHELTNAEMTRIQQTLGNNDLSDDEKRRSVASMVNGIVVSQQMSQNYQQGVEAQQSQQEAVQRK
ncbi:MAG: peptidoglycan DD-metalloendopeptidase family protein [Prevotella sp.]|nr:peptidoglycan DD-metalloendopeptidase family protein [Prevotella sp.]